ncbi:MAG TPA: hypothetical protein VF630_08630, partial [Hymenobacter sp.]
MNKFYLLTFVTLLTTLSIAAVGQSKAPHKTEQEIKMMLCHKWKLTHMETGGKRMKLPPEMG